MFSARKFANALNSNKTFSFSFFQLLSTKSLRTPSNLFLMNLAVFDLLMATEMPFFIANSFYERMRGHSIGCTLYSAAGALSGIGGAITNAMIALDRYKCVSSPMDRLTKSNVLVCILITWLWAFPPTLFPALQIWGKFIPEGFLTTCSFDYLTLERNTKWFTVVLFTWAYTIPMIVIVIFYYRLYGHVRSLEDPAGKSVLTYILNSTHQGRRSRKYAERTGQENECGLTAVQQGLGQRKY
jgi:r-opsin